MTEESKHNLLIIKMLDAPLERVWRAWTDPRELQKWWGPRGVTNPVCTWEARAGGQIEIVMLAGEELGDLKGSEWPMKGTFQEITPFQKLVYTSSAIMNGKPIIESINTVTFEEQNGKTKMTLRVVITSATLEAEGPLAGMESGWNQSIDKLVEILR
jgi:uncharacterized protein YndB with AHSA1/START domain